MGDCWDANTDRKSLKNILFVSGARGRLLRNDAEAIRRWRVAAQLNPDRGCGVQPPDAKQSIRERTIIKGCKSVMSSRWRITQKFNRVLAKCGVNILPYATRFTFRKLNLVHRWIIRWSFLIVSFWSNDWISMPTYKPPNYIPQSSQTNERTIYHLYIIHLIIKQLKKKRKKKIIMTQS